jgi:hypothetical protein
VPVLSGAGHRLGTLIDLLQEKKILSNGEVKILSECAWDESREGHV